MMRRSNNQAYACQIGSLVYLGCASFKKKRLLPAWRCSEAAAAGKGWLGDGLASSSLRRREFVNEIARRQHPAPEPARQGGKQLEALPVLLRKVLHKSHSCSFCSSFRLLGL